MIREDTYIFIEKITIQDFRAFSGKEQNNNFKTYTFELGKHITCISGHNGIGKSTILAMLSNCGELKVSDGRLLNGDKFSGEYSEIIKYDEDYDTTGNKCSIYFGGNLPDCDSQGNQYVKRLDFRAAIQNDRDKKRYRLIPKKTEERNTERKIEWPTYYLGLSRLYPIGESENVEINKTNKINDSIKQSIFKEYSKILNTDLDQNTTSNFINPSDAKKKKGVGIKTEKYGVLSNSSGQDNLGQILTAVFSFENLKNNLESCENSYYAGGILLIDEIDATLHPSAQNKLFKFLYKKSQELNLQIVFTTHSLSLLEYITKSHGLCDRNRSLVLQYLTNGRGKIEIKTNPTIDEIKHDLLITYTGILETPKIDVITEDDVGRWLLKNIIEQKQLPLSLNYLDCNFGYEEISKLIVGSSIFINCLVVFDPDISKEERKDKVKKAIENNAFFTLNQPSNENKNKRCLLILPGGEPIETIIWNYIKDSPENHDMYYNHQMESQGVTKRNLIENAPEDIKNLKIQKNWFYDNRSICDIVIKYWINDNSDCIDNFVKDLKFEYNKIASTMGIKPID